jgi:hypothetical protein
VTVTRENRFRYRQILVSRGFKVVFIGAPERFAKALAGRFLLGPLLRWLFLGPDDRPHRAGEIVLAELRLRTGFDRYSIFDPDPHVLAYREGQRAVVMMIFNLLNLDEAAVQQLMEVDDGLGE